MKLSTIIGSWIIVFPGYVDVSDVDNPGMLTQKVLKYEHAHQIDHQEVEFMQHD